MPLVKSVEETEPTSITAASSTTEPRMVVWLGTPHLRSRRGGCAAALPCLGRIERIETQPRVPPYLQQAIDDLGHLPGPAEDAAA